MCINAGVDQLIQALGRFARDNLFHFSVIINEKTPGGFCFKGLGYFSENLRGWVQTVNVSGQLCQDSSSGGQKQAG